MMNPDHKNEAQLRMETSVEKILGESLGALPWVIEKHWIMQKFLSMPPLHNVVLCWLGWGVDPMSSAKLFLSDSQPNIVRNLLLGFDVLLFGKLVGARCNTKNETNGGFRFRAFIGRYM